MRPEPEVQSAPTLHARDEMGLQPTLFVKTGHHHAQERVEKLYGYIYDACE
jgi:hypothetical protein